MLIALDAMGGDHGPQELIAGALLAVEQDDLTIALVGDETVLSKHLEGVSGNKGKIQRLQIVHAPTVIGMDENPVDAIRKKRDCIRAEQYAQDKNYQAAINTLKGCFKYVPVDAELYRQLADF